MNISNKLTGLSIVVLVLMTFMLPFVAFAQVNNSKTQTNPTTSKPADKGSVKFDPIAFRNYVNLTIDKVSSMEKSKIKGIDMGAYSNEFRIISETPQVEKVMDISNVWFLNISKLLNEMSKYKTEMEVSEERDLRERLSTAKKIYEELEKKLKYQLNHPLKISKK